MYKTLMGLLFLSLSPAAWAQPALNLDAFDGVKAYYQPGFAFLDTGPLNRTLEGAGFSPLSSTFITQGGGAHLVLERVILGASGQSLQGFRTTSSQGGSLSVSGGYGLFQLGYQVWAEDGFSLYPILGIGGGHLQINGSEGLNSLFGLSQNTAINRLETSQVVLDLGLGADYLIDLNGDSNHRSGLLVGLKMGYVFVPSPPQWENNRQVVSGSALPNLSSQGPYISLSLGLGHTPEEKKGSLQTEFFND